ncbi:MAG: tetratricopeptide repeat protein [Verrucomicrobiota bacterium]
MSRTARWTAALVTMWLAVAIGAASGAEEKKLDVAPVLDELIVRATQGDVIAQFVLAGLYEERGSYTNAFRWYQQAAQQAYARAEFKVGFYYTNGRGVLRNYTEAVRWYLRAADQGVVEAQYNLGVSFEKGLGTAQNYVEALKWYRRAADQGDAYAQKAIGVFYERGHGVAADPVEACKWYHVAASASPEAATLRDALAKRLKPVQVEEAKRRAAAFKPTVPVITDTKAPPAKAKPKDFLD